jgi:hypothetical protein
MRSAEPNTEVASWRRCVIAGMVSALEKSSGPKCEWGITSKVNANGASRMRPRKAVCAGKCPGALTLGTMFAVWTTKLINAAPNFAGRGKARLIFVDLAFF